MASIDVIKIAQLRLKRSTLLGFKWGLMRELKKRLCQQQSLQPLNEDFVSLKTVKYSYYLHRLIA